MKLKGDITGHQSAALTVLVQMLSGPLPSAKASSSHDDGQIHRVSRARRALAELLDVKKDPRTPVILSYTFTDCEEYSVGGEQRKCAAFRVTWRDENGQELGENTPATLIHLILEMRPKTERTHHRMWGVTRVEFPNLIGSDKYHIRYFP